MIEQNATLNASCGVFRDLRFSGSAPADALITMSKLKAVHLYNNNLADTAGVRCNLFPLTVLTFLALLADRDQIYGSITGLQDQGGRVGRGPLLWNGIPNG